jgi:hypothetical protein
MVEQTVDWLVQEVRDLLDVSNVGLYEFMDILNGVDSALPDENKKSIAWQALLRILGDEDVVMYRTRWPSAGNLGDISRADLPPDPWSPPGADGSYLAIDRDPNPRLAQ